MSEQNPPAFPSANYVPEFAGAAPGMTLRDWFAGHILPVVAVQNVKGATPEHVAIAAYEMADLMLTARAKSGTGS